MDEEKSGGGFRLNENNFSVEMDKIVLTAVKYIWVCPNCQNEHIEIAPHLVVSCGCIPGGIEFEAVLSDCQ